MSDSNLLSSFTYFSDSRSLRHEKYLPVLDLLITTPKMNAKYFVITFITLWLVNVSIFYLVKRPLENLQCLSIKKENQQDT